MEENQVITFVENYFSKKKIKFISSLEARYEFLFKSKLKLALRPDIIIRPKYAKRKLIAIEAKGSNFEYEKLLGQLLVYYLDYGEVLAAIPEDRLQFLIKMRRQINKKLTGFNFGIISVNSIGKISFNYPKEYNVPQPRKPTLFIEQKTAKSLVSIRVPPEKFKKFENYIIS
jgi:hypothetical protein